MSSTRLTRTSIAGKAAEIRRSPFTSSGHPCHHFLLACGRREADHEPASLLRRGRLLPRRPRGPARREPQRERALRVEPAPPGAGRRPRAGAAAPARGAAQDARQGPLDQRRGQHPGRAAAHGLRRRADRPRRPGAQRHPRLPEARRPDPGPACVLVDPRVTAETDSIAGPPVPEGVGLAPLSTLGVGGPARFYARAEDSGAVEAGVAWAEARGLPLLI